jgi:hypothetical protein
MLAVVDKEDESLLIELALCFETLSAISPSLVFLCLDFTSSIHTAMIKLRKENATMDQVDPGILASDRRLPCRRCGLLETTAFVANK